MDFKTRINSCGRFSTDENFKKIIMKNSCRLRQNSTYNQKEVYMNSDSNNNEQNNIKTFKGKSYNDKESTKQNFEKTQDTKKYKNYQRYISNKDPNQVNKINPTSSNILFFYQDIRALKLYKTNKNENNISSKNDSIKAFNDYNKTNDINLLKIKKNSKNTEGNEIHKNKTMFNEPKKNYRHFILKRIKDLNRNFITNEKKLKKELLQRKINNTILNSSFYLKNKSITSEAFSTEINNSQSNKLINKIKIDNNNNLYKKPNKLKNRKTNFISNSVSVFQIDINKIQQNVDYISQKEEKNSEKKNMSKNNSELCLNLGNEDNIINYFFCELIDLSNGMEEKSLFDILVNNLNRQYIFNYKQKKFPISNPKYIHCFRYFYILVTPLLFLSKDNDLYKYSSVKGHLFINQFIYSSLCYIGENNFNIPKLQNFIKKYNGTRKISLMYSTISFIKLIFGEKVEYKPLKNALIQLIKNISNESVDSIIKILNETILFCFNNRPKEKMYYHHLFNRKKSQDKLEENSKNSETSPSVPFIKTSMKKEFCLVLDIDETISHSLKLSFGYYFLLRPGAIDFLNELSNYYEINIFTCSLKLYADFIIDKIDTYGDLISYRLYKNHVTFEKGKSVKNLNLIGRDLNKIIFVDNLKYNAKYNLKNLYQISSWTDDIYDNELIKLKNKLKYIATSGKYNDDITKGIN